MNYEKFKEVLLENLEKEYPADEYDLVIRRVLKNNGMQLDGLCIFKRGKMASPTIYLENYYQKYKNGMLLVEIIEAIKKEYEDGMNHAPAFGNIHSGYEMVKDHLILRLINYEMNQQILMDCPHIRFHDLAVSFRWLAHHDKIGISTALISNSDMERWGITTERLYEDALFNTQRIFPSKISSLESMVQVTGIELEKGDFELYVLTNNHGINGATCILYDDVLAEFADTIESDFYVLPSSIHEVMLCPVREPVTEEMLLSLVSEANRMVVSMGEVLSDHIYYYNRRKKHLFLIKQS